VLVRSASLIHTVGLVVALLGFAAVVEADPITYVQSGVASGMIGGSAFADALVQVTVNGDTSNVVSDVDVVEGYAFFANVSSATTVTIPGVGTATVTDPTVIVSIPTPVVIDNGFPELPYVIIGTIDNPATLGELTGLGGIGSNALLGYDLQTSIGPITAIPGGVFYPTGLFVHTTLGNLSFTANISPTDEGTFAATVVPEPMSLLLLGSGIVVLAGRARFRARG
jgi:hypothetical protein